MENRGLSKTKRLVQSLCYEAKRGQTGIHESGSNRGVSDSGGGSSSRPMEERLVYSDLNLDTHPAVTRLQNEQNQRLESMEQRMNRIRKSAQQEAERRKFRHLFRARSEDKSQTELLLKEASLALELIKKEKKQKKNIQQRLVADGADSGSLSAAAAAKRVSPNRTCQEESDAGEIIPVHVVGEPKARARPGTAEAVTATAAPEPVVAEETKGQQPLMWLLQPVETFQLNGLALWLVLPFLLPVLLLLHLIRHFSAHSDGYNRKKN